MLSTYKLCKNNLSDWLDRILEGIRLISKRSNAMDRVMGGLRNEDQYGISVGDRRQRKK